jgi:hypothetical protein
VASGATFASLPMAARRRRAPPGGSADQL